ncbi:O-antigen ligase family protein [Myroides guanonis]|uniref:O-antigen ligase n=1 Tax=Myroides guanonis TaxID=1150112 RepID=A0A1I3RLY9_9FLAO|nr:O-antigen ligase family protein [Myroides guanonis]SFJ46789.1 O-antigen ligase [Myroides guanonis]
MEQRLVVICTAIFCFLMPIYTKLGNVAIGLLVVSLLFYIVKQRPKLNLTQKNVVRILFATTASMIILLTVGLFFTDNLKSAMHYYENYSSYLLLPLLFSFVSKDLLDRMFKQAMRFFVYGSVLCSLILMSYNFIRYFKSKGGFVVESDLFSYDYTYHVFTELLRFHPTLLGIYILFSILIIRELPKFFNKYFRYTAIVVLVACLLFLNSRSALFCFFIYFVISYILKFREVALAKGSFKKLITATLFGGILLSALLYSLNNTYMEERFTNQLKWELTENAGTSYEGDMNNDSRFTRWKAIVDVAMEKPFFGYGSGSEDRISLIAYEKHELHYARKLEYGPHNQYLSIFVEYGLFGLVLFLYFLYSQFKFAWQSRNRVYFFLVLFIVIGCLFDSILYLNTLIIFVAFFFNLFTYMAWRKEVV